MSTDTIEDQVVPVRVHKVAPEMRMQTDYQLRSIDDDDVYLEGVAVPYNTWQDVGSYDERFAPGVFATSLQRRKGIIPLLVNHKVSEIAVGRPERWDESDDALRGVWKFDTRAEAREVARLAQEGLLTGLSVHFQPGRGKSDNTIERADDGSRDGRPKVTRHHARLMEVSLVTVPAYPGAEISMVRTAGIAELEERLAVASRADEIRASVAAQRERLARLEVIR